jgi:chromosome segregation ATPase
LSSVEEITGEMRRLILKCRSLESKLEQSVPKKAYQEAVAKLQENIDRLTEDLQRTKADLGRTESLGGRLNNLSTVVLTLSSQISTQNDAIKSLVEKYQVPHELHNKALSRVKELELTISKKNGESVPKTDYELAQARIQELETKLAETVPKENYTKLMDEIGGIVSITSGSLVAYNSQIPPQENIPDPNSTTLTDFTVSQESSETIELQPNLQQIQNTEAVESQSQVA